MVRGQRCDSCGGPAVIHFTDPSMSPSASSHSCENQGGEAYRKEIRRIARSLWNNPACRESAVDFIAREVSQPPEQIHEILERGLRQLSD
jgi:hypothetical protein